MKKNIVKIISVMALLFAVSTTNAQIFLDGSDEELSPRTVSDGAPEHIVVPTQGETNDQYNFVPVGGGILLLAGFAGAYAAAKRRRH